MVVCGLAGLQGSAGAQDDSGSVAASGPVYVVEITETIDLGLAPYLARVLGEAEDAGAAAVVVDIDTPGGRLDAVIQMRDALIDSPLRTLALVDASAFSAGALVAIACEEIHMTPGAVMGAATPVQGGTGEVADEKTISAVRATFASTAEERGRDPEIAEAMVDTDVEIDGLVEQGSLLTLTASQAVDVGYAESIVTNRAALLDELGLAENELVETSPSFAERLVRLLTNPIVASLLVTVGTLALIGDLLSGGVGIGVVIGLGSLALFFWGHMLAGLAGWEDVALVVLGLALIAVEVFVVPGFGVPGVLGLVALLGGAFLAMLFRDFDFVTDDALVRASVTVGTALVAIVVGLVLVLVVLSRRGPPGGLVLRSSVDVSAPVTQRATAGWLRWFGADARLPSERVAAEGDDTAVGDDSAVGDVEDLVPGRAGPGVSLTGAVGTALSDLRPAGIAEIDGERVDVVTTGDYVRRGETIEVVSDENYRRVVRRRPE